MATPRLPTSFTLIASIAILVSFVLGMFWTCVFQPAASHADGTSTLCAYYLAWERTVPWTVMPLTVLTTYFLIIVFPILALIVLPIYVAGCGLRILARRMNG